MSTLVLIFLQAGHCGRRVVFANFDGVYAASIIDPRSRIFLSGIIQKTGPFAAVDVKAEGKH
ncbi:hypothetical protein [Rhizobium sp. J15]|uniref:hypothetical protein n=1 Tax=Rhizobium sp. J15 TaxID=2035450 RepID=UPI0011418B8F|nr:hypothetical protein [Rhizobium sp. J15]